MLGLLCLLGSCGPSQGARCGSPAYSSVRNKRAQGEKKAKTEARVLKDNFFLKGKVTTPVQL